jgi:alpha-galactosidase
MGKNAIGGGTPGCHILCSIFLMSQNQTPANPASEIRAFYLEHDIPLDAAQPAPEWRFASPVTFNSDWQGKNPDDTRQTRVLALWSKTILYLRFECRFRELFLFADAEPNGRRDHLWDRDVAEAFLQPEPSSERYYREFEVSPNGMWIDLDIVPGGLSDFKSGMQRSVFLDHKSHRWNAELAIPIKAVTQQFDPNAIWRVNFYRIEGSSEPRTYFAWRPTNTPEPNFHVPSAFGTMRFVTP